jgi:GR25 family glycosyltransferase involved in LPS biosynthesis
MSGLCDVVYVVNLDKSVTRCEFMDGQLKHTGVIYERFSAIYGYDALITNLYNNEE